MIAAPPALPLGRFGSRILAPDREAIAAEIGRLSALLARLDRERRRSARASRRGPGHSRRRGDCSLPRQAVDELLERFGSGETMTAIAAAMGFSRGAVSGRLHRLRRETAAWGEAERARLCDLLAGDVPFAEAGPAMGVSAPAAACAFAQIRRDMGKQAL